MRERDQFRDLLAATQPPHPARLEHLHLASRRGPVKRLTLAALVSVIAVGALGFAAWPAFASGWLARTTLHEVDQLPPGNRITVVTPNSSHEDLASIQRVAGFTPLVPVYLPIGCAQTSQFDMPAPVNGVTINYSCGISIIEQTIRREAPQVGVGSGEQILVNGTPAVYVEGGWIQDAGESSAHWEPTLEQQLILEVDGLFIHIAAPPAKAVARTVRSGGQTFTVWPNRVLPKDELIRLAGSLRPVK